MHVYLSLPISLRNRLASLANRPDETMQQMMTRGIEAEVRRLARHTE